MGETKTVTLPPSNTDCPTTTTETLSYPTESCRTCYNGCRTLTNTVFVRVAERSTSTSPSPTPRPSDCTATVQFYQPFYFGPTETLYTTTTISTIYKYCGGCEHLATRNLAGIGPVVHRTAVITVDGTATETVYECSGTPTMTIEPAITAP